MKQEKYSSDNPNPIDKHVGTRLSTRRKIMGFSQEALADKLGITFQQVQKYENATNRVSASKLADIAEILKTDVNYYYEGLGVKSTEPTILDNLTVAEIRMLKKLKELDAPQRDFIFRLVDKA